MSLNSLGGSILQRALGEVCVPCTTRYLRQGGRYAISAVRPSVILSVIQRL